MIHPSQQQAVALGDYFGNTDEESVVMPRPMATQPETWREFIRY